MSIHPQIIEKEGRKEFVVLPYEEFVAMQEAREDLEDLKELRSAKAESADEGSVSWDDVRKTLG
ncbi:MAG: type II toxin-antitoxin system Phd/YefM family antitoxin [Puniceicoccales bacterium]